ncbi:MAG TPA: hypothetical protein PKE45_04920, partial [Caldilineaceae bacterium]|nr:hypothetical protein [Caldilineaceae bacterium]
MSAQREMRAFAPKADSAADSLTGDPATTDAWRQLAVAESTLRAANLTHEAEDQLLVERHIVTQQGDQLVIKLIMHTKDRAQAYRQTRFYRHTAEGWQQTYPDAALWGPERSLATPSFVFHFRQNDAAVVIAVAAQVDALYRILRGNFGLPLAPTPEKLVIEVSVTQNPGSTHFVGEDRLVVASPALYLAPVELTDAELLEQSIALPLLTYLLVQASEYHALESTWQPLLSGLRLWQ